jgi:hypothetical protein
MAKETNQEHSKYYFSVSMNYVECEELYRQQIKYLIVTSIEGKRIRLPKHNMQKFISPKGLQGSFELEINKENKLVKIQRMNTV